MKIPAFKWTNKKALAAAGLLVVFTTAYVTTHNLEKPQVSLVTTHKSQEISTPLPSVATPATPVAQNTAPPLAQTAPPPTPDPTTTATPTPAPAPKTVDELKAEAADKIEAAGNNATQVDCFNRTIDKLYGWNISETEMLHRVDTVGQLYMSYCSGWGVVQQWRTGLPLPPGFRD